MSVSRLHPVTLPKPDVSRHDRIVAALDQALADQHKDEALGQSAKGIAIIFFREYPDGSFGESWIIQGMNSLEAIGLMSMTAVDLCEGGITGGPDHFPPEEPPAA